ncbi:1,4-alpha-glucan branching enzyme [Metabacillus malikii]|uniref:1,4-alpha-glucan branching enzyme GlgB n=1 Tax=Metabacillus malikii TaxID=1504265 RepID=A0ABT9ZIN1_9BACI|nr:1,4-alpha-glucan branching enzyme [Metabacillus malikii]MDQ0231095.1 1,4-alpha-glucan branching enzyme [Metabacillus malikii]
MTLICPTDFDIHLFHEGQLFESYRFFGAHIQEHDGVVGTNFCVWAPHARSVHIVGDFNGWNGENHPMQQVNEEGIWALFVPEIGIGELYKYQITTANGNTLLKSDPFAFYSEVRPNTASIVYDLSGYEWNDQKWRRRKRIKKPYDNPLSIYEVHLGSWKIKGKEELLSYTELIDELIPYVIEHGFTHIELLPIIEHPYDRSWGYQGTGYYSATSRYGTPHDLMRFIDACHQENIGVIVDWVPGHFCKDAHGLYMFDGEPTFEYAHFNDRENLEWGTANFDLAKPEVQSFLISNAIFWIEYFHVDGFRVDAVANMLHWPNSDELVVNEYAVGFLKKLNEAVFAKDEHILMIAEDSTDWPMVTAPTSSGGLGFNYKWNMGWMNDILTYMETAPEQRQDFHHKVSFSLLYAFSENFILPFSHDEVVHGKKSLLNKMPGDYWQKFAQLRLLHGYMIAHPGKKLLFMGGEFGQFDEWKDLEQLDWMLEEYEMHSNMRVFYKDLMHLYSKQKPLFELDHVEAGFEWIDVNNREQSIFSFIRKSKKDDLLVIICNFKAVVYHDYKIGVPVETDYIEILNSDSESYGGSGQVNKKTIKAVEGEYHGRPFNISITVPPYGIVMLRAVKKRREQSNGKKKVRRNVTSRG